MKWIKNNLNWIWIDYPIQDTSSFDNGPVFNGVSSDAKICQTWNKNKNKNLKIKLFNER